MGTTDVEHVLDLVGTGFFSRGTCTGCAFTMKGHAEDIQRAFDRQHETEQPFIAPSRVVIPVPLTDPMMSKIEQRIIVLLAHHIDFHNPSALYVALGLAEARSYFVEDSGDPRDYVSALTARIAHMSKHQREKLRHPTRTRAEQHQLMEA